MDTELRIIPVMLHLLSPQFMWLVLFIAILQWTKLKLRNKKMQVICARVIFNSGLSNLQYALFSAHHSAYTSAFGDKESNLMRITNYISAIFKEC